MSGGSTGRKCPHGKKTTSHGKKTTFYGSRGKSNFSTGKKQLSTGKKQHFVPREKNNFSKCCFFSVAIHGKKTTNPRKKPPSPVQAAIQAWSLLVHCHSGSGLIAKYIEMGQTWWWHNRVVFQMQWRSTSHSEWSAAFLIFMHTMCQTHVVAKWGGIIAVFEST